MKKNIICTVTNDLAYDQRMNRICNSLSKEYNVTLIGRCYTDSPSLKKKDYEQMRIKHFFRKGKLFYLEYNLRLFFFLLFTKKFEIINAIDLDTIMPCFFAAKIKGSKLVLDSHEWFTEVPEVERRPHIRKVWKWIEKTFLPKVDLLYTVSNSIALEFEKMYNKKSEVIFNAPNLNDEKKEITFLPPVTGNFILYQGAVNEGRGLEAIISSAKELPFPVVIAGGGDVEFKLKELVNKIGIEEKVIFTGKLKPEELKSITQKAWLGINLMESRSKSYYFSLANKFFDYPAALIPQICMDFPEYRAINTDIEVALLIPDLHKNTISNAINRLFENEEYYVTLKKNCKTFSQKYNWQNEEKKLLRLYEQLFR